LLNPVNNVAGISRGNKTKTDAVQGKLFLSRRLPMERGKSQRKRGSYRSNFVISCHFAPDAKLFLERPPVGNIGTSKN
jgi:hypothetical protein